MSRLLSDFDPPDFGLRDIVEFDAPWPLSSGGLHDIPTIRLTGEIVRVYNTRTVYHVEVDGSRYEVTYGDNPKLIKRA